MTAPTDAYRAILAAGREASVSKDCAPVLRAISEASMSACAAEDDKFTEFNDAFELVVGDERLLVQYRWYDTSKAFSIQPDMNVYRLKHTRAGTLIAEDEIRFLDKT
ncbi:hypothetical protein [Paracoccus sp. TOH]|uniref:hypothetical protein n=1 Tax=Paracoccus sp. TOH TaxID=1263728 RepID=UPI0025B0ABB0|nr:hypothetical protein [Paracoccus sp. TOH]WJS84163.1 hypothetical protein NBE95_10380 [Paracoccus sp. TOH]